MSGVVEKLSLAVPEAEELVQMLGTAAGSGDLQHLGPEEPCSPAQAAFPWLLFAERRGLLYVTQKQHRKGNN